MAFLSRILLLLFFTPFGILLPTLSAAQEVNKAIVKVVPFSSLQKNLHPFQTDCRNILREPKVEWDQIEIVSFKAQNTWQLKISGEVLEDLNVRFWSRRILLYDKDKKPMKPVILPPINLPLKDEHGFFLISLNVPDEANMISVPLEFYGTDRFRYLIHVKNIQENMTAEAFPNLDKVGRDFCTRDLMWGGLGLMGALQKQDTSPIVTTLDLSSFTFDNLSFERRWNWKVDRSIRVFAHSGTFQFNNFLDVAGGERVVDINADLTFTQRHWNYKNNLFKVQYGVLGAANFERRPYAVILSSTQGSISVGQHISVAGGAYAELFSHNNEWYTEATLRFHPAYLGLDHTYSGMGFSGTLGIAKPFGYERALGIYSYGTMFQGKHSGADSKDNSDVFYFQTHLEVRYGWLF